MTQTGNLAAAEGNPNSNTQQSINRAALVVMTFFILSRLTGLAREVIIGAQFGASAELDVYLAAFRAPDILFQLIAGGALGSAFIPTFAQYWTNNDQQGAWLLLSRLLNLVTLVLVVMAAIIALFALPLVQWIIVPGFSYEKQLLTASLMRWMLLGTIVFGASGLIMGALNAVQHFLLPAAAPIFYNLAIILGAWLLAPTMGAYGLVVGTILGAVLHLAIQLPGLVQKRFEYNFDFTWRDPGVINVIRLMGPRALGLFTVQMQFLVNTILASGLPTGRISALNYAWILMLLPQGVFAQAIATATFPTFAAQVASGNREEMGHTFNHMFKTVLFLTIPAAVGLYVLRFPIIRLLERGEFTGDTTILVAYALQFYAIGLVAHSVLEIIVRAFYALHDTITPVVIGIGAMALNICLSIWWLNWLSYGGLALANSVATSLEAVLLLWLLQRKMADLHFANVLNSLLRIGVASLGMGLGTWFWLKWLEQTIQFSTLTNDRWFVAISSIFIALLIYGSLSLLTNRNQLIQTINIIRRNQ